MNEIWRQRIRSCDFSLTRCRGIAKITPLHRCAPLPQLDRGSDYESERRGFESPTAHHFLAEPKAQRRLFLWVRSKDDIEGSKI